MLRAGEKMPKYTMPWIYRTTTSITKSSLNRSLDHVEDQPSKKFGGSLQFSSLLCLSRSISTLLAECNRSNKPTRQTSLSSSDKFRQSNNLMLHDSYKPFETAAPTPTGFAELSLDRLRLPLRRCRTGGGITGKTWKSAEVSGAGQPPLSRRLLARHHSPTFQIRAV